MDNHIKIIECPRDAMQGIPTFIPSELKIKYINQLLKVGFDTIDFGSFVSPKAIPQMKDTATVLKGLNLEKSKSKLLAIVANERGAIDAVSFDEISYIGYPFSVSETFQKRNTNLSIDKSLTLVEKINTIAKKNDKKLVIYLSMCFGNPYGEIWNTEIVHHWAHRISSLFGIKIISLSDTIGSATIDSINDLFGNLIPQLADIEIGAHLHSTKETAIEKIDAVFAAGCRRFDGALKGYGGCPMAKDELVGNMPTEIIVERLNRNDNCMNIDANELQKSITFSANVFI